MEFKEFSNPLEQDYDINSSYDEFSYSEEEPNKYFDEMIELIGILEDVTEEELLRDYGITEYEYLHPNAIVIEKIKNKLNENNFHR